MSEIFIDDYLLLLQAQKQIFNMLKFDSYPRFLRSGEHAECARADLRGMPLPYDTQQHNDSSKVHFTMIAYLLISHLMAKFLKLINST